MATNPGLSVQFRLALPKMLESYALQRAKVYTHIRGLSRASRAFHLRALFQSCLSVVAVEVRVLAHSVRNYCHYVRNV